MKRKRKGSRTSGKLHRVDTGRPRPTRSATAGRSIRLHQYPERQLRVRVVLSNSSNLHHRSLHKARQSQDSLAHHLDQGGRRRHRHQRRERLFRRHQRRAVSSLHLHPHRHYPARGLGPRQIKAIRSATQCRIRTQTQTHTRTTGTQDAGMDTKRRRATPRSIPRTAGTRGAGRMCPRSMRAMGRAAMQRMGRRRTRLCRGDDSWFQVAPFPPPFLLAFIHT